MQNIIFIDDFFDNYKEDMDATDAVYFALEKCKDVKDALLVFTKGTYHFYPEKAYEKYYFISNNEHGLKRITFPLIGYNDIEINGNGSNFIFHGRVIPFAIENSKNVVIKNIEIDYDRPFFTQGIILNADHEIIDLIIDKNEFPFHIEKRQIIFSGYDWEVSGIEHFLEFDAKTLAPTYKIGDEWGIEHTIEAEEIEEDVVRLKGVFEFIHNKGNFIVISHGKRLCPSIFITASNNIFLENINIYNSGAMGVIAQDTCDIILNKVNIKLQDGKDRIISSDADATHFVNCTGTIKITNCIFENQLDDATNVHGIFTIIKKIYKPNIIDVEFMHPQQVGVLIYHIGDTIQFINRKSLLGYGTGKVKEVKQLNYKYIRLVLEISDNSDMKVGDAVENISRMPNLIIQNCRIGKNRARGFLITTPGKVLVENCIFYSSGSAILIEGDANYWFESGCVKDIEIRNNKFIDCGYSLWGNSVIYVNPQVSSDIEYDDYYHKNIRINNNLFRTFENAVLAGHSIDGLAFKDNIIEKTTTYKPYKEIKNMIDLKIYSNVNISDNEVRGFDDEIFVL